MLNIESEPWFKGNDYYFAKAKGVAEFSDCVRRKVGAVLISRFNGMILGTAFNSAAGPSPRCYECPRSVSSVEPYTSYSEGAGLCYAVHAEARLLLRIGPTTRDGCIMFVTCEPCHNCKVLIAECRVGARWPENAGSAARPFDPEGPGFSPRVNP